MRIKTFFTLIIKLIHYIDYFKKVNDTYGHVDKIVKI